jgi:hypothetical protein
VRGAEIAVVDQCFRPTDQKFGYFIWKNFVTSEDHGEGKIATEAIPKIDTRRLLKILVAEGCSMTFLDDDTNSTENARLYDEHNETDLVEEYYHLKNGGKSEIPSKLRSAAWVTNGRKPFKAAGDRYGLANWKTEVGDLVCVLHGSDVPVILRECPGDLYKFIGQCYFEDSMYGEAIIWDEDEEKEYCLI